MKKAPTKALACNLLFTRHGTVWATWRLSPVAYGFAPAKRKKAVKIGHQALFQAVHGEALLFGLTADVDPASVVEQMLEGVDVSECDEWREEALLTLDALEDLRLGTRAWWFSVPLRLGPHSAWKEMARRTATEFGEAFGLAPWMPGQGEIDELLVQAAAIERSLPTMFNPRPATVAEHIWIGLHHQSRGLGLDRRIPSMSHGGDVQQEILQLGSVIPRVWLDEGAQTDLAEVPAAKRLGQNPFSRRYLKVAGGAAGETPSYQSLLAMTGTPRGGITFPGTEWLALADELDMDLDIALRMHIMPATAAKARNRKAENTINEQYNQRTDGGITGSSTELDATVEDLVLLQKALDRSDKETRVQVTAVLAVGADTADEVRAKTDRVKAFYNEFEFTFDPQLGLQEELWWAMQPGVPTSREVRALAQLTTGRDLAAAIPLASTDLGSQKGSILGMNVSSARRTPVFLDIEGSVLGNKSGSFAFCAESGAGKSYALKKIAGDVIDRGGRVFVLDHSDTKEWADFAGSVTDSVSLEVVNPSHSLDALRLFGPRDGGPILEAFFTTLLNIAPSDELGVALSEALDADYLHRNGIGSASELLEHLKSQDCPVAGAQSLARRMNGWARKGLGKVIFDPSLAPLPLDSDALVMCTRGCDLPTADELANAHLFRQLPVAKVFGRSVYALLARIAQYVCFKDIDQLALFIVDEAHHVTVSPETTGIVELFVREGRRSRAAIGLGSHDAALDFGNEAVRGLIPVRVVMRHTDPKLAARALEWIGLNHQDDSLVETVQGLSPMDESNRIVAGREGEGLMRDQAVRYGLIQVTRPGRQRRHEAIVSTPEAAA
ncbi:ATP-binding protein [Sinomonas sp. JGH33]|uniref:ATP-binding protein n=1 Tax=Sinomonas terricola TaxID=3110330 RepID=A0ABU5TBE4_9MICC|nr:ATP-binding protein [Sinomonas sp. JGH33]MEA5456809.1 ATP-binding protein [Sinomonas sp. JGH33]